MISTLAANILSLNRTTATHDGDQGYSSVLWLVDLGDHQGEPPGAVNLMSVRQLRQRCVETEQTSCAESRRQQCHARLKSMKSIKADQTHESPSEQVNNH